MVKGTTTKSQSNRSSTSSSRFAVVPPPVVSLSDFPSEKRANANEQMRDIHENSKKMAWMGVPQQQSKSEIGRVVSVMDGSIMPRPCDIPVENLQRRDKGNEALLSELSSNKLSSNEKPMEWDARERKPQNSRNHRKVQQSSLEAAAVAAAKASSVPSVPKMNNSPEKTTSKHTPEVAQERTKTASRALYPGGDTRTPQSKDTRSSSAAASSKTFQNQRTVSNEANASSTWRRKEPPTNTTTSSNNNPAFTRRNHRMGSPEPSLKNAQIELATLKNENYRLNDEIRKYQNQEREYQRQIEEQSELIKKLEQQLYLQGNTSWESQLPGMYHLGYPVSQNDMHGSSTVPSFGYHYCDEKSLEKHLSYLDCPEAPAINFGSKMYLEVNCPEVFVSMNDLLDQAKEIGVAIKYIVDNNSGAEYVCMLQISTAFVDFVIDALLMAPQIKSLRNIFEDPSVLKIFKSVHEMQILENVLGFHFENSFHVVEFCLRKGLPDVRFPSIVAQYTSVRLCTACDNVDWSLRPLSTCMKTCARQDVHFLVELHEMLIKSIN